MIRNKILLIVPAVILLFIMASCGRQNSSSVTISGRLPDGRGATIILQEMGTRAIQPLDTATIGPDGTFSFIRPVREPGFWLLTAPSGKVLVLLVHPGDELSVTGQYAAFPDHIILKGPQESMKLNDFYRDTRVRENQVDSLEAFLLTNQDSTDYYRLATQADSLFRLIWLKQRAFEMEFITANPSSLASLVVLNYAFGRTPVLNPDSDLACYRKLDSTLMKEYPGNPHVIYHHQRMEEIRDGR